jgi:chorismate mutase/prephenate dehydratase
MRDLQEIRQEIDQIDDQIVQLYEARMKLTSDVAEYKINTGKPVFDKEREESKLTTLTGKASSSFTRHGIRELFEQIMAMSRKKQYKLLTEHGMMPEQEFTPVDHQSCSNARIVFQGLEGAYSQQAMEMFFGENCDNFHVASWKDAMEAIRNGSADYAVLPIENSSAGIVSENYDLLVEYDNYIVGEQIVRIDHALLGLEDADERDISTVLSHKQSLMQCSDFLDRHNKWERMSVSNNAVAAKKVKEEGLITQAAIASAKNAQIYGLKVIRHSIQNNKDNSTRFIVVTNRKIYTKNAERISICFELNHESGALYHALSHFIYNGINMTNIQSRPSQNKNWEYRFFIDFEGNFEDHAVQNALRGLKEETISLKILGTY